MRQQLLDQALQRKKVGLADEALDDLAAPVDQHAGGRKLNLAEALCDFAGVVDRHAERQLVALGKMDHKGRRVVAHGHRQGLVAACLELLVQGDDLRHLMHATRATGGPEIHQHDLAAKLMQAGLAAVQQRVGHIRRGFGRAESLVGHDASGSSGERHNADGNTVSQFQRSSFMQSLIQRRNFTAGIAGVAGLWGLGGVPAADAAGLTESDAALGIRAALERGAVVAVELLGRSGGFLDNDKVRIQLPGFLNEAAKLLKYTGQQQRVDELVNDHRSPFLLPFTPWFISKANNVPYNHKAAMEKIVDSIKMEQLEVA